MGLLAWLFGRKKTTTPPVTPTGPAPSPAPRPPLLAVPVPAPSAPAARTGSAAYWRALDVQAVERFTQANIDRIEATARKDTVAAARHQLDYDYWFDLHRQYRRNELEAEAKERAS